MRDFTAYTFKPQLRTVGPKYGKQLGGIKQHLDELDGNAAMDELESVGALKFDVNGTEVELTKEDLLIDMAQKPGSPPAMTTGTQQEETTSEKLSMSPV